MLIVISGASGTGKGTVCKRLLAEMQMYYSISATTRQPREGETDGVEYYFISVEDFKKKITEGKFLEYAEVYGNFYGTPLYKIEEHLDNGENVLLEIDTQGAVKVMEKMPEGVYIFLLPPSLEELYSRIKKRGTEDEETLQRRFNSAKAEIEIGKKYQYAVINDKVDAAVDKIKAIITAESLKVQRSAEIFNSFLEGEN